MTATHIRRADREFVRLLARAVAMSASGEARRNREASGVSLEPLAIAAGMSVATLSRWERGLVRPSGAAAARWVRLLDDLAETRGGAA